MIAEALCQRTLDDGRILAVLPLLGNRARLTLGPDEACYETGW
jgi:hypothetical protein